MLSLVNMDDELLGRMSRTDPDLSNALNGIVLSSFSVVLSSFSVGSTSVPVVVIKEFSLQFEGGAESSGGDSTFPASKIMCALYDVL